MDKATRDEIRKRCDDIALERTDIGEESGEAHRISCSQDVPPGLREVFGRADKHLRSLILIGSDCAQALDALDAAERRIAELEAEVARLREGEECHVARPGEGTYECRVDSPCPACRLRAVEQRIVELEEAVKVRDAWIEYQCDLLHEKMRDIGAIGKHVCDTCEDRHRCPKVTHPAKVGT